MVKLFGPRDTAWCFRCKQDTGSCECDCPDCGNIHELCACEDGAERFSYRAAAHLDEACDIASYLVGHEPSGFVVTAAVSRERFRCSCGAESVWLTVVARAPIGIPRRIGIERRACTPRDVVYLT